MPTSNISSFENMTPCLWQEVHRPCMSGKKAGFANREIPLTLGIELP